MCGIAVLRPTISSIRGNKRRHDPRNAAIPLPTGVVAWSAEASINGIAVSSAGLFMRFPICASAFTSVRWQCGGRSADRLPDGCFGSARCIFCNRPERSPARQHLQGRLRDRGQRSCRSGFSEPDTLDIVALVDTSGSVEPRFRANMQHVLKLAKAEPNSPGDKLSIIAFSALQPTLICSGNCRSPSSDQKLHTVRAQGATPLYDALSYTAEFVSRRRTAGLRQVVILFSDGNDTISRASPRDAFEALLGTGAVLYAVNVESSDSVSRGSMLLRHLSEASGGRSLSARAETGDVLQTILSDLRSAYVVTYPLPSRQEGFHSLHILPKHNLNLRFHSRRGYSYEENH
jgi:Mg-chelatase subunit ChlD